MVKSVTVLASDSPSEPAVDSVQKLAFLRQSGADRFDPVQFHFLEVLAQRATRQPHKVRRILETRFALEAAALESRSARAGHDVKNDCDPDKPLGEKKTSAGPLGALAHYAGQHLTAKTADHLPVQYFRNAWSRISTDKHVSQALDLAPKNAGPINSHMLVLRSLALMRDVSPDYLNRFVSYVDTLLCLDHLDRKSPPTGSKVSSGVISPKAKARVKPRRPGALY